MDAEWLLHCAQGCWNFVRSLFTVGKNAPLKHSQEGWRMTISIVHSREYGVFKDTDYGLDRFMIRDAQKKAHLIFDVFVLLLSL